MFACAKPTPFTRGTELKHDDPILVLVFRIGEGQGPKREDNGGAVVSRAGQGTKGADLISMCESRNGEFLE